MYRYETVAFRCDDGNMSARQYSLQETILPSSKLETAFIAIGEHVIRPSWAGGWQVFVPVDQNVAASLLKNDILAQPMAVHTDTELFDVYAGNFLILLVWLRPECGLTDDCRDRDVQYGALQ